MKRIGIIFGGRSSEYDVSLESVRGVIENMDPSRWEPVLIGIDRKGCWYLYQGDVNAVYKDEWQGQKECYPAAACMDPCFHGIFVWKKGLREEAEERDFRRTGGLIASIGYEKTAGRARDLRYIDIYPQGKDRRGTRYAAVAYILHCGTPGSAGARAKRRGKKFPGPGIPKTLWVDDAEARSEEKAREAMWRAWEEG